mgnify:CR=1 FL=1
MSTKTQYLRTADYEIVLLRLYLAAAEARLNRDAFGFADAVDALYDFLPPDIEEEIKEDVKKLREQREEAEKALLTKYSQSSGNPITKSQELNMELARLYWAYASTLLSIIKKKCHEHGLLIKRRVFLVKEHPPEKFREEEEFEWAK